MSPPDHAMAAHACSLIRSSLELPLICLDLPVLNLFLDDVECVHELVGGEVAGDVDALIEHHQTDCVLHLREHQ